MSIITILVVSSLSAIVALLATACQPIQGPSPTPTEVSTPTVTETPLPPSEAQITLKLNTEEITSRALEGNLLGDPATRKFYVLVPQDYETTDLRYPVVYVLPWGNSTAGSNVGGFKGAFEKLLGVGEAREMILVFPDGSNKLGASLFRSSPTIGDYETYLVQELVDYVDANYRTLAASESRGLAGCSNGGDATMRVALKYPNIFSVAAPSGGLYDETMEKHELLLLELDNLRKLPESPSEVAYQAPPEVAWYIQTAAGSAPNPDSPPLFLDMPFRIVDGKAEIVPEVSVKIVENDKVHEALRYVEQPSRLRGILIQHALRDPYNPTELVRGFDRLLTEQGVEHEYLEFDTSHCSHPWEETSLRFMSEHLVFDEPEQ